MDISVDYLLKRMAGIYQVSIDYLLGLTLIRKINK